MNFLFPLYLAGAAAVALPIYLHLRRRPPKDSVEFSSLMFLEPTEHQPLKRRSQLEHIPLLLLRCLALLLLAAMFSRPFFADKDSEAVAGLKRTVILLDVSASMQRADAWEQAVEIASGAISEIGPEGGLGIITIGQSPRTLFSFDDWRNTAPARRADAAGQSIADVSPGWGGSDLGSGMMAAAEMVADAAAGEGDVAVSAEIILVSDLQSGADLDAIAEAAWPDDLSVTLAAVEIPDVDNAAISIAASLDPERPMVRVRNDPESGLQEFIIRAGEERVSAVVPPGESRFFQLDSMASEIVLEGDGDGQGFDNRAFLAPLEAATVKLQFMGDAKPDDSNGVEYYFRRAFGLSDVLQPQFVDSLADGPQIIAIARPLESGEISELREVLEGGGRALLIVDDIDMAETLGALVGTGEPDLEERGGGYSLLERIDFDHPVLAAFRDPRWRDFTDVHFWRHRVIDPADLPDDSKVIARFDSGAPAWIEIPVGGGALMVMMSGWHPRDSQLSLSTKFVPLLFSLFADAGPQVGGVRQFFVGEPLPLAEDVAELVLPSGERLGIEPGSPFRPGEPGIYRADGGVSFAVNLRPSESELSPLGREPLLALGVPLDRPAESQAAAADRELPGRQSEASQALWRWAVLALLALLAAESWLGARPSPVQPATEASA
ncbi:MAG: BatA domain-containing protein [Verrucomicrobiales bacterium]